MDDKKVIGDLIKAVDELERMVQLTRHLHNPDYQTAYSEAKDQLDQMRDTARLFQIVQLQAVFLEIDTYTGTTVDDLRRFMQKHNLTFAPAKTPDEKKLYPELYER